MEHAAELWDAASEREIWRYMLVDVRSPEDLQAWVRSRLDDADGGTALPFLQRDATTHRAFGSTSLFDVDLANLRMEIGHTWIGRSHRRTPANTEAKLLLLEHGFERLAANRVQFKCDARNQRSRDAILRLGATFEGILRSHAVLPHGDRRDTAVFSIVREEWPAVRERLQSRLAGARGPVARA